mmetsp:Transcript_96491/g.245261  ORF Transcript_96491/g.245261 Transcript_96491/m.245261 type:complete len:94 (+) Transcript_96491:1153-1434(+)
MPTRFSKYSRIKVISVLFWLSARAIVKQNNETYRRGVVVDVELVVVCDVVVVVRDVVVVVSVELVERVVVFARPMMRVESRGIHSLKASGKLS